MGPREYMLTAEKSDLLRSFLGGLPGNIAARLAKAVEVDRLTDGKALPHDMIMEGLRPVLRENQPRERTPTPLRLLCRPFEDFLFNGAKKSKRAASRAPAWFRCGTGC